MSLTNFKLKFVNYSSLKYLKHSDGFMTSVTRLGNLLDFGQVFEALGNN